MSEVTKEIENILLDKNFNLDNYDYQYILNLIKNNQNYLDLLYKVTKSINDDDKGRLESNLLLMVNKVKDNLDDSVKKDISAHLINNFYSINNFQKILELEKESYSAYDIYTRLTRNSSSFKNRYSEIDRNQILNDCLLKHIENEDDKVKIIKDNILLRYFHYESNNSYLFPFITEINKKGIENIYQDFEDMICQMICYLDYSAVDDNFKTDIKYETIKTNIRNFDKLNFSFYDDEFENGSGKREKTLDNKGFISRVINNYKFYDLMLVEFLDLNKINKSKMLDLCMVLSYEGYNEISKNFGNNIFDIFLNLNYEEYQDKNNKNINKLLFLERRDINLPKLNIDIELQYKNIEFEIEDLFERNISLETIIKVLYNLEFNDKKNFIEYLKTHKNDELMDLEKKLIEENDKFGSDIFSDVFKLDCKKEEIKVSIPKKKF